MKNKYRMKTDTFSIACCFLLYIMVVSCQKEEPNRLIPTLSLEQAQEITRYEATLSGSVTLNGEGELTRLQFRYGKVNGNLALQADDLTEIAVCDAPSLRSPSVRIKGLTAGTTYGYCLEAGNGSDWARSEIRQFSTLPNQRPSLSTLTCLGQGPLSALFSFEVTDDGGEVLTEVGVYCADAKHPIPLNKEMQDQLTFNKETQDQLTPDKNMTFQIMLDHLQPFTLYEVKPYAVNARGETIGEAFSFKTDQAVSYSQAGMLRQLIGEEQLMTYKTLQIAAPLNGSDIACLREMMGRKTDGTATDGQLASLNLTDASIVAGGSSFDYLHGYTHPDTISQGMFAYCQSLRNLSLPASARVIEKDAFKGATAMESLTIPVGALVVLPSEEMTNLQQIVVADGNASFASSEGVLYDKEMSHLYWFPQGKTSLSGPLPTSLTTISAYAFRQCQLEEIDLPDQISVIETGAFAEASIQRMSLPNGLRALPQGLLQGCQKLTELYLGNEVHTLNSYCLADCPSLIELHITNPEPFPPMCKPQAISEEIFENCVLFVPKGLKSMFQNHETWRKFRVIREGKNG